MVRSCGSSACSSRTWVSGIATALRGRAAGQAALLERLLGQHLAAGQKLLDRGPRLGGVQRPVVALVDRGHRRAVARPQALAAVVVDVVRGPLGGGPEGIEQLDAFRAAAEGVED